MSLKILWQILNHLHLNQDSNNTGTINADIAVPSKYLSSFGRTLEMLFINPEINIILTWSENCVISEGIRVTPFAITDTKLYVPVVTLST